MKTHAISFDSGLANLSHNAWNERLCELGDEFGHYEDLGPEHRAVCLEAGPKLFVTFEHASLIRRSSPRAEPRGFAYTRRDGWSTLAIISDEQSWFRDPAIFAYFDRLTDDGFFDDFDKILFHGANAAGYAACAYSVAAPGSTVLALSPQATLTPRLASFDPRNKTMARVDFTSRYGFAPDMIEASREAFVVFDPARRLAAIHAAMFTRDHVTPLRAFGLTEQIEVALDRLDIHEDLIRAAMAGSLSTFVFADQYRARRDHDPYLKRLLQRAVEEGHLVLAARAARLAATLTDDADIRALHEELSTQIDDEAKDESVPAAE